MFADLTARGKTGPNGLPTKWTERSLRSIASEPIRNGVGESAQGFNPSWPRYVRITDIAGRTSLKKSTLASLPPTIGDAAPLRKGDLLIAAVGATYGKSYLHTDDSIPACYAGFLVRVSPTRQVSPDFLSYWTLSTHYWNQVHSGVIQSTIQNFSAGRVKRLRVLVPPVDEQAAIVKYLGHAHARIDGAIAAKRRLIALLEEQKQAIIHQAVTRGLDPTVPLKDSGVPWLGEIPAHWDVARAKHLFTEFDQRSGTGREPLLSLRAAAGLVYHDEVSSTPVGPAALEKYKVVTPGNLVMNRMRAASGLFAVASVPGLVSPDYSTMSVDSSVDAGFYLRLFKTQAAMAEFKKRSTGLGTGEAGFMRLYSDDFGRVPLPLPPIEEQRAIASTLDAELGRSSAVATKALNEIELLREFHTRLTSDVVTGQVDVREIAATLPELTDDMLANSRDDAVDTDLEDVEDFTEGEDD